MRVTAVAAMAIASGCSFTPGVFSSDARSEQMIDAAIDSREVDANLDIDGDGVLTSADNCPLIANADQHDEDGDQKGDACDPCPQGGADADGDGDGIGDGCDPHPTVAGDVLVRFEGFGSGTGVPAMWTAVPSGTDGLWSVSQDSLHITVGSGTNRFLNFDTATSKTTVDLAADLADDGGSAPVLSALLDVDSTVSNSYSCAIRFDVGTYAIVAESGGAFSSVTSDGTAPPGLPDTYRIRTTLDAAGMACDVKRGSEDHPLNATVSPNRTRVGIRVRDITATIHYIAIYKSP